MKWDPKAVSVPNAPLTGVMTYSGRSMGGPLLCVEVPEGSSASVLLYRKGSREPVAELPFPDLPLCGRFRVMKLEGIDAAETEYNFRIGDRVVTDPSARLVRGLEKFGDPAPRTEHQVRGAFMNETYDWGGDTRMLQIPFSESVLYELHVRSFTKSPHSGVKHKGTFLGLEEKLPYLKSLGITGVVLMPCFEFDEVRPEQIGWRPAGIPEKKAEDTAEALPEKKAGTLPENTAEASSEKTAGSSSEKKAEPLPEKAGARKTAPPVPRLNVWGYGPGWYFAPKRSYCATSNPADEFRHMVRAFHEAS